MERRNFLKGLVASLAVAHTLPQIAHALSSYLRDLADNLAAATGISTGHPYRFDIDAADGAGRYALHFNSWQEWTSALVWATGAGAVGTVRVSARR